MTTFSSFTSINVPGSTNNYSFIAVTGVDAAGQAVGDYGDIGGDFSGCYRHRWNRHKLAPLLEQATPL